MHDRAIKERTPRSFLLFGIQNLPVVTIPFCLRIDLVRPARIDIIDIAKGMDSGSRLFAYTLDLTVPHASDAYAGNLNRLARRYTSGPSQNVPGDDCQRCKSRPGA